MRTNDLMKSMCVGMAIMLNLTACNGQQNKDNRNASDGTFATNTPPKVDVRVNREYDEQGNLIHYDSTYSSIYHGHSGDAAFIDSVFNDLRPRLGEQYPFLDDPGFNDLFFNDSLLYPDFFHGDFFRRRMERNNRYMEQMMSDMDSLKNAYFGFTPRLQDGSK